MIFVCKFSLLYGNSSNRCHPLTFYLMNIVDTRLAIENFYLSFFSMLGLQRREKKIKCEKSFDVGYSCSRLKKNLKDCFDFVWIHDHSICPNFVCNIPVFAPDASLHTTYSHISLEDRLPLIYLIERVIILNENKTNHNHAIFRDCSRHNTVIPLAI
jgi:hypothetical protein